MKQTESTQISRRHFTIAGVSAGATLLAADTLFAKGIQAQSGSAQEAAAPAAAAGANTSFRPLKQVDAGLLNVGYAEDGPADGPVVMLLHGWPYDIYSFVDVAPLLASKGYRVIVPYLRGYGTTRFLSERHLPEWTTIGRLVRHHRVDRCSQNPEGNLRRVRLGRTYR